FDSPWVFGRLLDWDRGGFLQLTPADAGATMFRQYRRDSNVLQTIWTLEHSRMRVVDFMLVALRGKKLRPPESLRLVRMLQPLTCVDSSIQLNAIKTRSATRIHPQSIKR